MEYPEYARLQMLSDAFQALSNPVRLQLMESLKSRPRCVCELAQDIGVKKSLASKYLSQLQQAGLVRAQKSGVSVTYHLTAPCVLDMCSCTLDSILQEKKKQLALSETSA